MGLVDYAMFVWAVFLLTVGLIFEASGFGIFVVGRLEGLILIVIGVTMFWAGWIFSGARGFSCVIAAVLNMFDAALTVAFWSLEINPVVLAVGPTIFIIAKVTCSLTIMLYAKLHINPRNGGIALATFFTFILGWNLSQHLVSFLSLTDFNYGILLGSVLSFVASAIVLYVLFRSEKLVREPEF